MTPEQQPIDLLSLWIEPPAEDDDDYTFHISPERPTETAILLTRENVEDWLTEDQQGEHGPWATKMRITLHDDIEQARLAAIREGNGYPEYITSFGRLASGLGAVLIQETDESFDGFIHIQKDGHEVSHRDPTRISYELTQEEIDSYNSKAIKEKLRDRKINTLFAAIIEAVRNDPDLIEPLQQRIEASIPGALIGINAEGLTTHGVSRFSGYDDLSFDQKIMLQEHLAERFAGCEDASPENLENFREEAEAKIQELQSASPRP